MAATEEFKLIQRAYDMLSDPEKKVRYDQQRDTLLRAYKPPPSQTAQPAKRFYSEAMAETMAHKKMFLIIIFYEHIFWSFLFCQYMLMFL